MNNLATHISTITFEDLHIHKLEILKLSIRDAAATILMDLELFPICSLDEV